MTSNGALQHVRHVRLELEGEADLARARLLETVARLARRRDHLLDWRGHLRRYSRQFAATALAVTSGVVVAMVTAGYRARRRAERRRVERVRALSRVWQHPDRVALPTRKTTQGRGLRILVALVTVAVAAFARRRGRSPQAPRALSGVPARARLP